MELLMSITKIILISGFCIGTILGTYAMFIEPFSLRITNHTIKSDKWTSDKPLTIALLADPHMIWPWMTKAHLQRIVNKTNTLNPDLVFLLGDYVGDHPFGKQLDPYDVIKPFEDLKSTCGVFGVLGNHDMSKKVRVEESWVEAMRQSPTPILDNQSETIECHGQKIDIAGIEDMRTGKPDITKSLKNVSPDNLVLFLTHNPDAFVGLPDYIDATFAGHTHAGQVRLPYIGALGLAVPSKYGAKYAHGHIVENDQNLIVSAGLGMTGLPIRFLNKPEITLVTITGGE